MKDLINTINDDEYFKFLNEIKKDIINTRKKVLLNANNELIMMYYRIGKGLIEKNKYGTNFINNLSTDLKLEFPDADGLSARNLRYMKKFAKEFEYDSILQHNVAKLPWGLVISIMDKVKNMEERLWYSEKALENLWTRTQLEHQIATDLYSRQALLDNKISERYSKAENYFEYASKAIKEMHRQQSKITMNGNIMKSGLIIRHMVIPGCRHDSLKLLNWLYENLPVDSFLLSLMSQFTPTYKCKEYPEINRRITTFEYNSVTAHAADLGFKGYTQSRSSADSLYTPDFNLEGI